MWKFYNPNPAGRMVGDCSVRAISKALDISWEEAYAQTSSNGYLMCDMPSSDAVWGAVLRERGFSRHAVPNSCPACYTIQEFAKDHPEGIYVVATGGHVATIRDGILFDSWDSSMETVAYYWAKED